MRRGFFAAALPRRGFGFPPGTLFVLSLLLCPVAQRRFDFPPGTLSVPPSAALRPFKLSLPPLVFHRAFPASRILCGISSFFLPRAGLRPCVSYCPVSLRRKFFFVCPARTFARRCCRGCFALPHSAAFAYRRILSRKTFLLGIDFCRRVC